MTGNNELTLNQATMIEALQMWLDAQMMAGKAPKVTSVAAKSGVYDSEAFVVALTDRVLNVETGHQ